MKKAIFRGSLKVIEIARFVMNFDWIKDGRKIPDDGMYYIRVVAVNSVCALGQSPEIIAKAV